MAGNSRFNSIFIQVAQETGMPADLLFSIAMLESGMNPLAVGDSGQSHGLFQIYRSAHPDISIAQARDPLFAARWTAKNFMQAYNNYGSYEAAIIHHNHPVGASYYADTGKFMTEKNQWYLQTTLGYQQQWLGGDITDVTYPPGETPPPDAQVNGQNQGDWSDMIPEFDEFPDLSNEEILVKLGERRTPGGVPQAFDVATGDPNAGTAGGFVSPFDMGEEAEVAGLTSLAIGEVYRPGQTGPEQGAREEPNVEPVSPTAGLAEEEEEVEVG